MKSGVNIVCSVCGCIEWVHDDGVSKCKRCKNDYNEKICNFIYCDETEIIIEKECKMYKPSACG